MRNVFIFAFKHVTQPFCITGGNSNTLGSQGLGVLRFPVGAMSDAEKLVEAGVFLLRYALLSNFPMIFSDHSIHPTLNSPHTLMYLSVYFGCCLVFYSITRWGVFLLRYSVS